MRWIFQKGVVEKNNTKYNVKFFYTLHILIWKIYFSLNISFCYNILSVSERWAETPSVVILQLYQKWNLLFLPVISYLFHTWYLGKLKSRYSGTILLLIIRVLALVSLLQAHEKTTVILLEYSSTILYLMITRIQI